jgi:hypothetical protein
MTIEVPLTQGQVALIDEVDAEAVLVHRWAAHRIGKTFYAAARARPDGGPEIIHLHTFLTGWPLTDHRNGNGLDNRRANLREATKSQNAANRGLDRNNTSGFKGVYWNKAERKWQAHIQVDGKKRTLGRFPDPEDAARAYDAAALDAFGEFAWLNFPEGVQ